MPTAPPAAEGSTARRRPPKRWKRRAGLGAAGGGRCAVVVSGATDYVTDGVRTIAIDNGHPMMPRVTGLGCTATAIVGACLAVESDALAAAVAGMAMIGIAGEIAGEKAAGPGSLQAGLLDALYGLDTNAILARARVRPIA